MFDEVFAARRRETEGFFSRKIPTSENRVVMGYVQSYSQVYRRRGLAFADSISTIGVFGFSSLIYIAYDT